MKACGEGLTDCKRESTVTEIGKKIGVSEIIQLGRSFFRKTMWRDEEKKKGDGLDIFLIMMMKVFTCLFLI